MLQIGSVVNIISFKHNSYIHRVWYKARVVKIDSEKIVVLTNHTRVQESTKRVWYTKEPAILVFYFKKWFNTIAMFRPDGIYYYTNISSPCVIENGDIKYIDYDIDLKSKLLDSYRIMDINEYYCHRYSMNYPKEIDKIVMKTLDDVIKLFKQRKEPFSDEVMKDYLNKSKAL